MNGLLEQALLQRLMQTPQVAKILNDAKSKNMSLEEYFQDQAKEKGVNPEEILNKAKSTNILDMARLLHL